MKTIIFSPHSDDAIFSLGNTLLSKIFPEVTIVTVFNISNYKIDGIGLTKEVTCIRKSEDTLAFKLAGINSYSYLDFEDAILRPEYKILDSYLDPKSLAKNDSVYNSVRNQILGSYNNEDMLLFPLGIGNHIDHKILFEIGFEISKSHNNVYFYKDIAYESANDPEYVSSFLKLLDLKFNSYRIQVPRSNSRKENLVKCYNSQLDSETNNLIIKTTEYGEEYFKLQNNTKRK